MGARAEAESWKKAGKALADKLRARRKALVDELTELDHAIAEIMGAETVPVRELAKALKAPPAPRKTKAPPAKTAPVKAAAKEDKVAGLLRELRPWFQSLPAKYVPVIEARATGQTVAEIATKQKLDLTYVSNTVFRGKGLLVAAREQGAKPQRREPADGEDPEPAQPRPGSPAHQRLSPPPDDVDSPAGGELVVAVPDEPAISHQLAGARAAGPEVIAAPADGDGARGDVEAARRVVEHVVVAAAPIAPPEARHPAIVPDVYDLVVATSSPANEVAKQEPRRAATAAELDGLEETLAGRAHARAAARPSEGRQRSKTVPPRRLTGNERRLSELALYPEGIERPLTRKDCEDDPGRPCPWVSCSHHLYLDANPETGSIKLNFPHLEVWEMGETCSLDVADRGGITLEEVGAIITLTRERIRQVEVRALEKIERNGDGLGLYPDRA
jgi:catechol 2,3-dioxygenase-like lactoylglutathione lyase family enzyme